MSRPADIQNKIFAAALKYARGGWPVFPCDPASKRPLTSSGFKDATKDTNAIGKWWQRWPTAMIGVPTGARSGIWAVDPDVPTGPGEPDGLRAWRELVEVNGGIPKTRTHATPSGGQHVLFRWSVDRAVTNSAGELPPGIDVRGEGGYIVVPPSQHANGRVYTCNGEDEVAEAPEWLYGLVYKCKADTSHNKTKPLPAWLASLLQEHAGKGVSVDPTDLPVRATGAKIAAALEVIPSDEYNLWFEIGCALYRELGDAGFSMFDNWSKKSSKYDARVVQRKWPECGKVRAYSAGTIFYHADEMDRGWRLRAENIDSKKAENNDSKKAENNDSKKAENNNSKKAENKTDPDSNGTQRNLLIKRAADLQTKTFDPLKWVVPNYLPEGLSVLAGKPKIGKSFLALDIAVAVASNGTCLGKLCEQGDVLALFLEDNDRRLKWRLTTMLGTGSRWAPGLEYATEWPRLADGGLAAMRDWIGAAARPKLIIVDILERVRQRTKKHQTSQYSEDYEALVSLHKLATEARLSILVLHHQRKMAAEDLIDTISGTLGLGGAADTVLILGKDDTGNYLYGRGRDLEEFSITVRQNEQCRWDNMGAKQEAQSSPERQQVVDALTKAGRPMRVDEIAAAVGGKKENVKNLLSKLHREGAVERIAKGLYAALDPQESMDLDI